MFSKELEEVIEAALADGVITEKERAVLHKRAAAEGVDPDELDVVIDGRLAKVKKQEDWLRPVPPQAPHNNKHGVVRKCPNCGAQVVAGSVKCAECGYEFVGIEANRSVTKLSEQLQGNNTRREISSIISRFPVPTTREDLFELIAYIQPKVKHRDIRTDPEGIIPSAYMQKYEECINKAKIFFSNDPQFKHLFKQYDKYKKKRLVYWWANLSEDTKKDVIGVSVFFGLLILFFLIILISMIFKK